MFIFYISTHTLIEFFWDRNKTKVLRSVIRLWNDSNEKCFSSFVYQEVSSLFMLRILSEKLWKFCSTAFTTYIKQIESQSGQDKLSNCLMRSSWWKDCTSCISIFYFGMVAKLKFQKCFPCDWPWPTLPLWTWCPLCVLWLFKII